MKSKNRIWWFILPSLLGVLVFYMIPYTASLYYAFKEGTVNATFGLGNFKNVLVSDSFKIAAKNTILFMAIAVPLNIIIPFMLAIFYHKSKKKRTIYSYFHAPAGYPFGSYGIFLEGDFQQLWCGE